MHIHTYIYVCTYTYIHIHTCIHAYKAMCMHVTTPSTKIIWIYVLTKKSHNDVK